MGRMKGKHTRSVAKDLLEKFPGKFSDKFDENKKVLAELGMLTNMKDERNKLAGEITNLVKRSKKKED